MWTTLWMALALMLVLEGLMPLLFPTQWKAMFRRLLELNAGQIRFFGLISLSAGVVFLCLLQLFS